MGAVAPGVPSTDSDLLAFVRLLADPVATQNKLNEFVKARTDATVAQAAAGERQKELDALAALLVQQGKDQVAREAVLRDREVNVAAGTVKLERDTAAFASESKAERAGLAEWDARLTVHAKTVADAEVRLQGLIAQAKQDAADAATARTAAESKLAKMRALAGE